MVNDADPKNAVAEVKYRGAWLLIDDGYLSWSCTVPPMKTTVSYSELRFSRWLESLRKDVECTFGILKGRFRIIKAGIRLHGVVAVDRVWLTCCAMHNMMVELDGLDASNALLGEEGQFSAEEIDDVMPIALQRLYSPGELRTLDTSGVGRGTDHTTGDDEDGDNVDDVPEDMRSEEEQILGCTDADGYRRVRFLSLKLFRKKLIEHFDIEFKRNGLQWPAASGTYT